LEKKLAVSPSVELLCVLRASNESSFSEDEWAVKSTIPGKKLAKIASLW
jgi:hypothetical protein